MTRWALADREYIVVATLVVALCACERNEPRVFTGQTMGTTYMVKVVGTGKSTRELEQGIAAALFEVNEVDVDLPRGFRGVTVQQLRPDRVVPAVATTL